MPIIHAKQALTDAGWVRDLRVTLGGDGRIAALEPGAEASGHRVGVLLPAPANLHSHAFQRAMAGLSERRGPDRRDSFWSWRQLMFRFLDRLTPEDVEAIAGFVHLEMLEAGFGSCTEFHYLHHQPGGAAYDSIAEMSERIVAAAAGSGIGLTLLPVHYRYGGCDRRALGSGQIRFGTDPDGFARLAEAARAGLAALPDDAKFGIAPHSLRAVGPDDLPRLVALARGGPIHMHLAEQQAEVDEVLAAWRRRPAELLLDSVEVDRRWCLIHCTRNQPRESLALARAGAVAGLCPITESSLGDGIFDAPRWLRAGADFGIGSDSNIRISLSEELRTLEYSQRLRDRSRAVLATPDRSTGRRVFEAAARGGARAAGRGAGCIRVAELADLLALDDTHVDLEGRVGDAILDSYIFAGDDRMVRDVWSAGRHLVQHGRHVGRDAIVARYRQALARLREVT